MLNTAALAAVAPVLATILPLATLGVRRRGATLRLKMPAGTVPAAVEQRAVEQLLQAGAQVRVLEGSTIWCPGISDGVVVWRSRRSRVVRTAWTTLEVVL